MTHREQDDGAEKRARTGELSRHIQEYLASVDRRAPADPPGFWEKLIAEFFEAERERREYQRLRSRWFFRRRRGEGEGEE